MEKAEHHESADNQTQIPSKTENKSDNQGNQVSESETQDKQQTKRKRTK